MKQLICAIALLMLSGPAAWSQATATLYYNENAELTTKEKATLRREALLDPVELRLNGAFKDYDNTGKLVAEGTYIDGEKTGNFKTYRNGALESVIEFTEDDYVIRELTDADGSMTVTSGTGAFTMPFSYMKSQVGPYTLESGILRGEMKAGKRDGKWIYEDAQKNVLHEEIYENGTFIKRTEFIAGRSYESAYRFNASPGYFYHRAEKLTFDNKAFQQMHQYFEQYPVHGIETLQRDIAYPGGFKALTRDMAQNMGYPAEARRTQVQGTVIVSLTIDSSGALKDIKVLKPLHPALDEEALRVLKLLAPKFCPALLNGKAYESTMSVPVSFRLG